MAKSEQAEMNPDKEIMLARKAEVLKDTVLPTFYMIQLTFVDPIKSLGVILVSSIIAGDH